MSLAYEAVFAPILADIEAEMRAVRAEQREIAPIMWAMVDYQFGWDRGAEPVAKNVGGKRIRPVLMALVAQAVCGDYRHVLPAAAALELLHNFTLIHDDVMDRSRERRHRPTIWTQWGSAQAINAGDGFYALANLAMVRLLERGVPAEKIVLAHRSLSQACLWTAEGQILDMDFETREGVTPAEYLVMVANKTGTLIESAAYIGALLSTDDPALPDAYAAFARNLGIAFQIRDDYLDIWGDSSETGKPVASDIRDRKKSYPVLVAFERAPAPERAELARIYTQDSLSDSDVQAVLMILSRAGAADHADQIARDHYQAALRHLTSTGLHNSPQDTIRDLAAFLIKRAY